MQQAGKNAPHEQEKPLLSRRNKLLLGAAFACVALFSAGLFFFSDSIGHALVLGDHSEVEAPHSITIGLDRLSIEENAIRFVNQRHDGPMARLDVALMWPEMHGYRFDDRKRFDDVNQTDTLIFIQISQSTMSRDMSGRIGPIYSQLFEGLPMPGPYGLTAHQLRPGSGYDGETLYTAPREGDTDYAIRCMKDESPDSAAANDCQRDIRIGKDLSVLYRFSRKNLADWQKIESAVIAYVSQRLGTITK